MEKVSDNPFFFSFCFIVSTANGIIPRKKKGKVGSEGNFVVVQPGVTFIWKNLYPIMANQMLCYHVGCLEW